MLAALLVAASVRPCSSGVIACYVEMIVRTPKKQQMLLWRLYMEIPAQMAMVRGRNTKGPKQPRVAFAYPQLISRLNL